LTDTNGVLSNYSVSCSDSRVTVGKSGNTITITSTEYLSKDATITLTKSSSVSASATLIPYGDSDLQDVLVGYFKPNDVTASFKINTPGGTLKLVKTSDDGVISGVKLNVTGTNYEKSVVTGSDGTAQLTGLIPGVYTVTEEVPFYYEPQAAQTVTIVGGGTSTVKFANVLKRGDLSVTKTSEDGFNSGVQFHLYGTSASGAKVDLYTKTDSTGVATFKNVLIANGDGYTLEEVDTAIRYVIPEDQNVMVNWKDTTNTAVTNKLKKFNVTVMKTDAETGSAQGDATLAGAVYGLYDGGELVETLTTNADGYATSGYHVCGDDWTIREITPSEGYLLDETVTHVGAEPQLYTVEYNSATSIASYEQVIKGNISIIKHHDDGSTQIETPEEGATFEVYLASAGSYENAKETERDLLVCDADGVAISKDLPYGIYTVHQTYGYEDTELMRDFSVYISQDGKTYKYLINNAPFSAYLKVVKADAETGETIALTGAGFQIYDADGNKVEMRYTYPTLTTIDTFYVSDDGYLITPQVLDSGSYTLVEVQAPYGYVLDSTPIPFKITTSAGEDLEGLTVVSVTAYDMAQKGTITITKSGEVFSSVQVAGDEIIADKDGNTELINCIYTPVYEQKNLADATYQVIAAEDIYTGDGTLRYAAGTVVDEITTGEDGTATSKELYLGKYQLVEVKAPYGCVLNDTPVDVELVYAGQEVSVTSTEAGFVNDRQKVSVNAAKVLEQDECFQLGMNGEITSVSFGLYAKEDITAEDGSVIPADGLIEICFADEDGQVAFTSDLPFGSYYVKELSTDPHYQLSDTVYSFTFEYAGQDTDVVTFQLHDGEAIENELIRGTIEGYKVDGEDNTLAGAVFGLFYENAEELTEGTAIMTAVSNENGYFSFENVPYGDYIVRELTAPEGYVLSDARHYVSITFDTQVIGLKVIDYPIVGGVQLTKVDAEYPENHLTGAVFEVYADTDGDGEWNAETDELIGIVPEISEGVYEMDGLLYGSYFVREAAAPEGFLLDENVYGFSITEDGQLVAVENEAGVGFMNQPIRGDVTIFKTDKDTGDKLVGAGFRVLDAQGNTVFEGYTGEDGTLSFSLRYGEYTVAEFEAPEGYVLDETPYAFAITEDGQTLSIDMANLKIKGKLLISKVDADTEQLLPNAGFRIYDVNGEVILEGYTDENGVAEFELEFGTYYYQEFDAPEGYQIDDTKYEFSITEDGQIISVMMTNKKIPSEEKTEETPKTETPATTTTTVSTDAPKTGDTANVALWAALAGLAAVTGCGLGVYALRKRKKED
jgi:uncharacterized surface anchored protein